MHPLFHLLPALLCIATFLTLLKWATADILSGTIRLTRRDLGAMPFVLLANAIAAVISLVPAIVWIVAGART
ncbi:hypothetical protein [Sandarakinorhabdus sp.]|uniref:hypothetical protein n=1 Tax=Sandarakinorhabdus sp. TaxID=1916663 RepID=UPI003567A731